MRRRTLLSALAGSTIARPSFSIAQPAGRPKRLGILLTTADNDPPEVARIGVFLQALQTFGWTEGRNVEVVTRWSGGDPNRMKANAREVIDWAPDVMLVRGPTMPYVRRLTTTVPIVFIALTDALALQLYISTLQKPGGNITGFASHDSELIGKRLEILKEVAPNIANVLYLRNFQVDEERLSRLRESARALRITLLDMALDNMVDMKNAVEALAREPNSGLMPAFTAFVATHRTEIVALAERYRLPAIYYDRTFPERGGLISYGEDWVGPFRAAGSYVNRILRGESPGDLPIQQPDSFDMAINLKTAKALGLTIPASILARADEVIE